MFLLPLALYIKTLSPTYIPIDSAEFAMCMKFWGVCHPPGFPLFTLIGHLFVNLIPFGSVIYKANLLSAIFGAGTILIVYLTLIELKVNKYISFALSLLFAVSSVFWEFSIAADVFTFATFLIALTFFFAFKNKPYLAFLSLGLSASHFYISAVLWPILFWYFWVKEPNVTDEPKDPKVKKLLVSGLAFSIGLFPQALMYLRIQADPVVNWGHAKGIAGFFYFVRRQEFGSIFLLSNPVLKFELLKLLKHFKEYTVAILVNFGVVLPILAFSTLPFRSSRSTWLLVFCFGALVIVQLTLLSTIDPTGESNPFQINKFYLSSFTIAVLVIGISIQFINKKFFQNEKIYGLLLLGFLVFIYFFANFAHNDYSKNRFSENLVLDAMSALPEDSIAITVSHVVYFGGRYEQEVNGRFGGVRLLYFPNEKNRDSEFYQKDLFANSEDEEFTRTISGGKSMGQAEKYVLSVISRNLDKPIFILQGTFEEGFFGYLKPYIVPHGLWWRVVPDINQKEGLVGSPSLFENMRNAQIKADELELKQQRLDSLTYAVSYHSTGVYLGSIGKYDEAISFFNKSFEVDPKNTNIGNEIDLIKKTRLLEGQKEDIFAQKDSFKLEEVGHNYFTLGNFGECINIFSKLAEIEPKDAANYNNLASCQASLGQVDLARENYKKALELDPNLELAKKGLEVLDD